MSDDLPRPVRVALSNDYELALVGLAALLGRYPEQVQIVDITTDPHPAHQPDIILFDTFGRLPDEDGKLRLMIAENAAQVVVYSWDEYPESAARAAGAAGYLSKSLGAAELVARLVAFHDNDHPEPRPTEAVVPTWPGQAHGLSEREAEMISFIVRGLRNEDIARRAYLSINTVKTYIGTAYRKIGVTSRSQAVAWGIRNGFESTDQTGL